MKDEGSSECTDKKPWCANNKENRGDEVFKADCESKAWFAKACMKSCDACKYPFE